MALSDRAEDAGKLSQTMTIWQVLKDLWDPETNPNGYVSLGVAENALMHDTLKEHIHSNVALSNPAFTYGDGGSGLKRTTKAISNFLTGRLKPVTRILPEHVFVTNGCTTAVEHLCWALGNPGDGVLLGQPHYGAFMIDIQLRPGLEVVKVPFNGIDPFCVEAVQKYEDQIIASKAKGQRIAALMLCHPHNPLGRCYPRETIIALMRLCQKYKVHLISDEIYALSLWKNTIDTNPPPVPYESVLSIPLTDPITGAQIIDPSLVHLIWGISKDFGANGLRLGALISQHNPALHESLIPVAIFSYASSMAEHVVANIFEDTAFVNSYIAENQRKLGENYALVANFVRSRGIDYAPGANAAFFLWVNLGKKYRQNRPGKHIDDITEEVTQALLDKKVFLANATSFGGEEPGWFRIVFSQPKDMLMEGLTRMMKATDGDGDDQVKNVTGQLNRSKL